MTTERPRPRQTPPHAEDVRGARILVADDDRIGRELLVSILRNAGHIVDAVVVEPCGAHPSYAQGHYDRDNAFYVEWDEVSREPDRLDAWLDEYVRGVADRAEYMEKLGPAVRERIRPSGSAPAGPIDYGEYR